MPGKPICVYNAATAQEAEIIIAWLAERGIDAHPKGGRTAASNPPLVPQEVKVCVSDPEAAERAVMLLAERSRLDGDQETEADQWFEVVCEACGQATAFPAPQLGTTQQCPRCGRNVNVPSDQSALPAPACPVSPRRHSLGRMILLGMLGVFIGMEVAGGIEGTGRWAQIGIGLVFGVAAGALGLKLRFG